MTELYHSSVSVFKHMAAMIAALGRINISSMAGKGIRQTVVRSSVFFLALIFAFNVFSQQHHVYPPDTTFVTTMINPDVLGDIAPGDVIFLHAGNYHQILVQNIHGSPTQPVRLVNQGGVVNVGSERAYYGISFRNCTYIEIAGAGECGSNYGFVISHLRGAGLSFGHLSSHVSASHIHIHNTSLAGIMAKSDLDCSLSASRDNFKMYNIVLHSNWLHDIGMEGMYIGSTFFHDPRTVICNGSDTLIAYTHELDGVWIYNNIIERTNRNAIQVSSAVSNCNIYDNRISYDSQMETPNQMGGIIIGGGSNCNCYNNRISHGKGTSIQVFGRGNMFIYNNIIEYPGRSIGGDSPSQSPQHGIFVQSKNSNEYVLLNIFNNTIVSPRSRGIWFFQSQANMSEVQNNVVIDPGSYEVIGFKAFIEARVILYESRNYYYTRIEEVKFVDAAAGDYSLSASSPLIDGGTDLSNFGITYDFYYNPRPMGFAFDVGALEFEQENIQKPNNQIEVFPNPAHDDLWVLYYNPLDYQGNVVIEIIDLSGKTHRINSSLDILGVRNIFNVKTAGISDGVYLLRFRMNDHVHTQKIIIHRF